MDTNQEYKAACDHSRCPAKVKAIFHKEYELFLAFCSHHYFLLRPSLLSRGWHVAGKEGILIRNADAGE